METKKYTQAPLPFQGQKRRWKAAFNDALKEFSDCHVVIDLFGGSGLLSRMTKDLRPDATVIYNDYDGYTRRLAAIPQTNQLLSELRPLLTGVPDGKKVNEPIRKQVLELVKQYEQAFGYVDYITLSASLLFSMKYATTYEELIRETLYNNLRQGSYNAAGYLDGLEVVSLDYKELFARWRHRPDVLFLIDPPYLSTDTGTYTGYWKLKDYLDVLHALKGTNYCYFTSNKSNLIELCEWLEANYPVSNPFHGAVKVEQQTNANYNARYTDIMLYKHCLNDD